MWPIALKIGDFELSTYGVLLVVAVSVTLWVGTRLGRRDQLPTGPMTDLGVGTLFAGLAGSKLLGLLVALGSGAALSWAELRTAGAVHGGLLGGTLGLLLLCRRFRLPPALVIDAYVPGVALGQAIGRVGCWTAGCCFGAHTDVPWAMVYTDPAAVTLGGVTLGQSVHPVQLYDAAAHVALFALLYVLHQRRWWVGALFGPWCILEGMCRFAIEGFRGDLGRGVGWGFSWLSTGRATALVFIALGLGVLVVRASRTRAREARP